MSTQPPNSETSPVGTDGKPFLLSRTAFSKFAALCGPLAILCFFLMLPMSGFLPPIAPWHTADHVGSHYAAHERGIKGGIPFMTLVSFFFPLYASAVGGQLSRIPSVPQAVLNAQLLGGCLGGLFLTLPAYFFATAVYRLDRAPELIQLLNDLAWIFFAMPFAGLLCQDLAFSYAILLDRRERPLFPRWLAYVTTGLTLTFWPALGVHCVHHGAVAWNGGLGFWTAGMGGGLQNCVMAYYTWKAVDRKDLPGDWEARSRLGPEAERGLSRVEVEVLVERFLRGRKGVEVELAEKESA